MVTHIKIRTKILKLSGECAICEIKVSFRLQKTKTKKVDKLDIIKLKNLN
jgi:hypothetical protein